MPTHFKHLADLSSLVGQDLGASDWILVDQARIDQFAHATGDHQWIHTDPALAAKGPFGTTVAHGFLTLSLLPIFFETSFVVDDVRMGLNYGLNKVRFPAPVPVGSRLRGGVELVAVDDVAGGIDTTMVITVEREGTPKPVCVVESLSRYLA